MCIEWACGADSFPYNPRKGDVMQTLPSSRRYEADQHLDRIAAQLDHHQAEIVRLQNLAHDWAKWRYEMGPRPECDCCKPAEKP